MRFEAALDLVWSWTPLMPPVLLESGTSFRINLITSEPCPNAVVLLFNEEQSREVIPLTLNNLRREFGNSYVAALWRASLAEPVNATFQVWNDELRASLGILQVGGGQHGGQPGFFLSKPGAIPRLSGEVSFKGASGHQLPPEEQVNLQVASVLLVAFLASLLLLVVCVLLRKNWRSKLHMVFFACFFLKALLLSFLIIDLAATDATGQQSLLRTASWQMLTHLFETSVILLFFLIGLGWKITRSNLRSSEWTFGLLAMGVSLLLRTMEVLCRALRACSPQRYLLTLFTVNSFCSLVIIVATNFNIFLLGRQLIDAHAHSTEAGVVYAKLQSYMTFRLCYLYFIMIPVLCGAALRVISWQAMWMVKELLEWLLLSAVLWLWRPGYVKQIRVFDLTENTLRTESEDEVDSDATQ